MQNISNTLTTTIQRNNTNYRVLRLRENVNRQNSQIGIQPLRLRMREHSEISTPNGDETRNNLTQEQVKALRLNKLGGSSQRPKLTNKLKEELEKAYKEYKERLKARQALADGPTQNKKREQNLENVIDQQPLELSLAQLRSLLRMRNNVPINENLIPNEGQIRQNIPEPIMLLDESQIRNLILSIMEKQNARSRQQEENNLSEIIPSEELQEPLAPIVVDFPIVAQFCYDWH